MIKMIGPKNPRCQKTCRSRDFHGFFLKTKEVVLNESVIAALINHDLALFF